MKLSKGKYKSSQDIDTNGLLLDILPKKFKHLNQNEKDKSMRKSRSSVMSKVAASTFIIHKTMI